MKFDAGLVDMPAASADGAKRERSGSNGE